jgi:hypothetical protein
VAQPTKYEAFTSIYKAIYGHEPQTKVAQYAVKKSLPKKYPVETRSGEELQTLAKKQGLYLIIPESRELLLDVDKPKAGYRKRVMDIIRGNGYKVVSKLSTKSVNGNTHWYFLLSKDLTPTDRILFQACLGSDPVRELLSYLRSRSDYPGLTDSGIPTALFETLDETARVAAWRKENKPVRYVDDGVDDIFWGDREKPDIVPHPDKLTRKTVTYTDLCKMTKYITAYDGSSKAEPHVNSGIYAGWAPPRSKRRKLWNDE